MASRRGHKSPCANCGQPRWITGRGLCYKCYADPAVRAAAKFRGGDATPAAELACPHCRRRRAAKNRRGLCVTCSRVAEIREQYPHAGRRKIVRPLTPEQRAFISDNFEEIRRFARGLAKRWGVEPADREELLGAAMENVCRRGATLVLHGPGANPMSFLLMAAKFGMKYAMKWGPFKRPNTVYLADMDTDGRQIVGPIREV